MKRLSSNSWLHSLAIAGFACSAWAGESDSADAPLGADVALSAPLDTASNALIEQGVQLRRQRKDREALKVFQEAFDQHPSPKALAQMALAEQALGQWVEAERDLLEALWLEDLWIDQNRTILASSLLAVRKHLGTLHVHCNAPRASLSVNGKPSGLVSLEGVSVQSGTAQIEVESPGYQRVSKSIVIVPERPTDVQVTLLRISSEQAPEVLGSHDRRSPKPLMSLSNTAAPPRREVRTTLAWALATGAGLLLAEAMIAHWQRERAVAHYNDDSRCVFGGLTREERCGAYRDQAGTAQTLALVGYVAGGIAMLSSAALFATAGSSTTGQPNFTRIPLLQVWRF